MMFPRKGMNPTRFDTIVDVNKASTDVSRCSSSTGVQIISKVQVLTNMTL